MVSYLIRTRNRPHRLRQTLACIARTHTRGAGVREVVVVDDGSQQRLICPQELPNGTFLRSLAVEQRLGWGAVNLASEASDPSCTWLVCLADDACPVGADFVQGLDAWDEGVIAVAPDLFIDGTARRPARRTGSSLPETLPTGAFAVRRDAFLRVGGFDPRLTGPATMVDLCARLIGGAPGTVGSGRIAFDPRWVVARSARAKRALSVRSLTRQLRDYAWALGVHAPEGARQDLVQCVRDLVPVSLDKATAERAIAGALRDIRGMSLSAAARQDSLWERLTGLSAVRATLAVEHGRSPIRAATLVDAGRHAWVVRRVLEGLGARVVDFGDRPDAFVVGSLSPARMLASLFKHAGARKGGAMAGRRVIAPWTPLLPGAPAVHSAAAA